jgi:uncharacterized iron-regulated protein
MRVNSPKRHWALLCAVLAALAVTGCTTPRRDPADPAALAADIDGHPVVIFGETHDNAAQHALRAATLRLVFEHGARPALAFEQFDRERQADIDAVRRDATGSIAEVAARIAALGNRGWNWDFYRPYLQIAIDYQVPIIAANLSRADAIRVAQNGFDAALTPAQQARLGVDRLPSALVATQQREIEAGHCGLLPADDVAPLARAQIARDAIMALEIAPYAARGVILLTGNGHARRDVGVARYLAPPGIDQAPALTIGLLEDAGGGDPPAKAYDVVVATPAQPRPDPCEELRRNFQKENR